MNCQMTIITMEVVSIPPSSSLPVEAPVQEKQCVKKCAHKMYLTIININ